MRASEERLHRGLRAVFRKVDITPAYPVSLLGYFNDRVSTGVLDPLYCRLAARGGYEALGVAGGLGGFAAARLVSALSALGPRV